MHYQWKISQCFQYKYIPTFQFPKKDNIWFEPKMAPLNEHCRFTVIHCLFVHKYI